ncbi:YbjP/YqhG family protein [Dryocola sp. BD586]|uniref:YbjP/YqhG family protein n=1 Tax=Dryocola sp. BD586 TaxID=3133271 RepID=UPI003F502027
MRIFIVLAVFILSACSLSPDRHASSQTKDFYTWYLSHFSELAGNTLSPEMQSYVALDTLNRLEKVYKIPEQEIVTSDYFTYMQDYDPRWIAALKVGEPQAFMGGETVHVWLSTGQGSSLHLKTYLRRENGCWKIYRVRDVADNFEHPLFNTDAIETAKESSQ